MNRENLKLAAIAAFFCGGPFIYVVIQNPGLIWGLDADSTCEDWNMSKFEYQIDFITGCGCLTGDQADKMLEDALEEKVHHCFEEKMKTCRGWEEIGPVYQQCATTVTGIFSR